ncbi:MAG: cadmium-translocating P-type ATPase [Clostridia bacterium]|nr:cadmium-translocating P-type ATPase [Clostridia bacterium]
MRRKHKIMLARIIVSLSVFAAAMILAGVKIITSEYLYAGLLLVSYFTVGWDILWRAVCNIAHGKVFDENFLMSIATVGAVITGEYPEAVFVMIFYQVGELFQSIAVGKSRKSIASLMEIRPDSAVVECDGKTETVDPFDVRVGEIIVVRPGEKIPLDGVIIEGSSSINTVALTGESAPGDVSVGDSVMSGCVNLTGLLRIKVSREFQESTVSKILELVENSGANKSKSENFITRFARIYTPIVVVAACFIAVALPLITGAGDISVWKSWIYRAMSFLVVSCPCALVISVPMSFFGGIGGMSRCGILVKGSNYLEALAKCDTFVFDKTGTLTRGSFEVTGVYPAKENYEKAELLSLGALCESASTHPIAQAICSAAKAYRDIDKTSIGSIEELAGYGIHAVIDGRDVYAGNLRLMEKINVKVKPAEEIGTVVYIARTDEYLGCILLNDTLKSDSKDAIAALKEQGVRRVVMLTGDKKDVADSVAAQLGVTEHYSQLLPADKVSQVERLLEGANGQLAFVGDGINDAPVLARADVGIAMGALGTDAAIEAADIVLMDDKPSKIPLAIKAAKRTLDIVKQNIIFVLAVKIIILMLVALGLAGMWAAVFADVGVAVIAILNAMRAMKINK